MDNKAFYIEFGSIDDFAQHAKDAMGGQVDPKRIGRSCMFADFEDFMKFMFPEKFALLLTIEAKNPVSMYDLAKLVSRPQPTVLKDCKQLEGFGFISLEAVGPRNSLKPRLAFNYNKIIVQSDLGIIKHEFSDVA